MHATGATITRRIRAVALLALAACAGAPPAAAPAPEELAGAGGAGASAYGLIGERERLALTGAQVTRLDSIAGSAAAANDSLRRMIREVWRGPRPRDGEDLARTRPLIARMAENNRRMSAAVGEVLNEEQRRIACELQSEQRAERRSAMARGGEGARRGRGGRGGGMGMRRPRGTEADSVSGPSPRRGWPWCPAPAPADPRG